MFKKKTSKTKPGTWVACMGAWVDGRVIHRRHIWQATEMLTKAAAFSLIAWLIDFILFVRVGVSSLTYFRQLFWDRPLNMPISLHWVQKEPEIMQVWTGIWFTISVLEKMNPILSDRHYLKLDCFNVGWFWMEWNYLHVTLDNFSINSSMNSLIYKQKKETVILNHYLSDLFRHLV